jgi:hypothetical protein
MIILASSIRLQILLLERRVLSTLILIGRQSRLRWSCLHCVGNLLADVLPNSLPCAFLFWNKRNVRIGVRDSVVVVDVVVVVVVASSFVVRPRALNYEDQLR